MRYVPEEFVNYVVCFDAGCEWDAGLSARKMDAYERLREWTEINLPEFSSFAEWQLAAEATFGVSGRFLKKVYSDERVIGTDHASALFDGNAKDRSESNFNLFLDMVSSGAFDRYVAEPCAHRIETKYETTDGLFSLVAGNLAEWNAGEKAQLALAEAWVSRKDEISKRRRG